MKADHSTPTTAELKGNAGIAADRFSLAREAAMAARKSAGRILAASAAGLVCTGVLKLWPSIQGEVFCRGAGAVAGLLTGLPVIRTETGWLLPAALPVVVTNACSGTHYFVLVSMLLGWHFTVRKALVPVTAIGAVAGALVLSIAINGLRVAALLQVHRWLISRFPDSFAPFLHMLVGVATFLPALILINLACETHGRSSTRHSH